LKILEAAACGKAIVSTALGALGLNFRHGRDLIVADSPAEFAGAVVSLINNPARKRQLGARAREASLAYDWGKITSEFRRVMESLA
jgi:glycosyltransferase involved in cell wall biosynthesis